MITLFSNGTAHNWAEELEGRVEKDGARLILSDEGRELHNFFSDATKSVRFLLRSPSAATFFLRGGGSILLREVAEANLSYFVEARLYLRAMRL